MDPLYNVNPDAPPKAVPAYPDKGGPGTMGFSPDNPLRGIVTTWLEKLKKAAEHKKVQFGDDAAECMRFFNGPYDFMYKRDYASSSPGFRMGGDGDNEMSLPAPTFQMSFNKVAEAVQLFGPTLYHKNPYRQCSPRKLPELPFGIAAAMSQSQPPQPGQMPPDPMQLQMMEQQLQQSDALEKAKDIARASLMEWYLNYTPRELGLKYECRAAVDEMMIKGMSVVWTEVYQPKGTQQKLVGSFYDTVDNLLLDPDFEQRSACMWAARKCVHPVWQVERDYNLPPGSLKPYAQAESYDGQSVVSAAMEDGDYNRKRGMTNDLITYYKIYSKMGIGGRLTGVQKELAQTLEQFGDYCMIVCVEGCPYPLNLPPDVIAAPGAQDEIMKRLEWPTPFWMDDAWPFATFEIHPVPRQLWPMSHFKPAMGLLKFLNWAYSFIASKMRITSRDFIAMKKSIGEDLKHKILHGDDLTLLEIETTHPGTITDMVQFLQHPQFNGDVWKVIEAVTVNFEKATGLSELMYGSTSTQMRSAQEANVKAGQLAIRPDDMANRVEDTMSEVAKLEAIAIRWHIAPQDVAPLAGQAFAFYWGQLITAADPYAMCHQLEYGIEAGSTKKPNKDRDQANMTQATQTFSQLFFQYASVTGNTQPFNALVSDWCKANDMDASRYTLNPPPPPPPPPGADKPGAGKDKKPAEANPHAGAPVQPQQPPQPQAA